MMIASDNCDVNEDEDNQEDGKMKRRKINSFKFFIILIKLIQKE